MFGRVLNRNNFFIFYRLVLLIFAFLSVGPLTDTYFFLNPNGSANQVDLIILTVNGMSTFTVLGLRVSLQISKILGKYLWKNYLIKLQARRKLFLILVFSYFVHFSLLEKIQNILHQITKTVYLVLSFYPTISLPLTFVGYNFLHFSHVKLVLSASFNILK